MTATTTLRLSNPEDLIAAAPALLGFHPVNSVVMIAAGAPSFQARVDLPGQDQDEIGEIVDLLAQPVERHGIQTVCLLYFTEERADALPMHAALVERFSQIGVRVPEGLHVTATHYESLVAPESIPRTYDVSNHPLLAEAVFEGRMIKSDRESLNAEVQRDADAVVSVERALQGVALEDSAAEAAWAKQAIKRLIKAGQAPKDTTTARLALGLANSDVRDAHWVNHTGHDARAHADAWSILLRRCPDDLLPGVASVVAMLRFRSGDGARAWTALDASPESYQHSLGSLVAEMLSNGVSPAEIDQCWTEAQRA